MRWSTCSRSFSGPSLRPGVASFQLKLDQVDVHGKSVFGEILEIPRLGRTDPRLLGNGRVELLSVNQNLKGISRCHSRLIQREELRIADSIGFDKRRNVDQFRRQARRSQALRPGRWPGGTPILPDFAVIDQDADQDAHGASPAEARPVRIRSENGA